MIKVTRINGEPVVVNADFIELVEPTPDTVISLTTGKKMMVQETVDEVIERIVEYRARNGARTQPQTRTRTGDDDHGAAVMPCGGCAGPKDQGR